MKKPNDSIIVKAYEKKGGNVSATALALGISRWTFYKWLEKSEKLKMRIKEIDESLLDFTESKLMEQINEGNLTAIIFKLKTQGKNRGYVERVEQDVNVNPFESLMKELPDEPEED